MNYSSDVKPVFCPGCGDYGVHAALLKALTDLNLPREKVAIIAGIGCSSSMVHLMNTYGIHGIHGRVLPIATGVKLANNSITVIGVGGDGDGYGIGGNHLLHAARRNISVTYIVMNNQIYGLTTGQASPTTLMGAKTKSTPFGSIEEPINPIAVAIAAGATYVARGFSGDPVHLAELIKGGIMHKGFALIDALSPCVTFNHLNTYEWFRQRVYQLADHDPHDINKAMQKALEFGISTDHIPLGLIYESDRPTYEEMESTIKDAPLASQPMPDKAHVQKVLDAYK